MNSRKENEMMSILYKNRLDAELVEDLRIVKKTKETLKKVKEE